MLVCIILIRKDSHNEYTTHIEQKHSSGKVVNVRTLVKNIRDKATEIIKGI